MVTAEEQAARDEEKRARASTKIRLDEEEIDGVTWIRHVRPEREGAPEEE